MLVHRCHPLSTYLSLSAPPHAPMPQLRDGDAIGRDEPMISERCEVCEQSRASKSSTLNPELAARARLKGGACGSQRQNGDDT